jgi:hypothetical protein
VQVTELWFLTWQGGFSLRRHWGKAAGAVTSRRTFPSHSPLPHELGHFAIPASRATVRARILWTGEMLLQTLCNGDWLRDWATQGSDFESRISLHVLQTGSGPHPASSPKGTVSPFPRGIKLTTHLQPVPGHKNADLYIHSPPLRLRRKVLNWLSTGAHFTFLKLMNKRRQYKCEVEEFHGRFSFVP